MVIQWSLLSAFCQESARSVGVLSRKLSFSGFARVLSGKWSFSLCFVRKVAIRWNVLSVFCQESCHSVCVLTGKWSLSCFFYVLSGKLSFSMVFKVIACFHGSLRFGRR